jgi:hypothetical protein
MTGLCFVVMPFGEKVNAANKKIDFDVVYNTLIKPAMLAKQEGKPGLLTTA